MLRILNQFIHLKNCIERPVQKRGESKYSERRAILKLTARLYNYVLMITESKDFRFNKTAGPAKKKKEAFPP